MKRELNPRRIFQAVRVALGDLSLSGHPVSPYVNQSAVLREINIQTGLTDEKRAEASARAVDAINKARTNVVNGLSGQPPQGGWPDSWF